MNRHKSFFIDPFTLQMARALARGLSQTYNVSPPLLDIALNFCTPPRKEMAHLSFPCFFLSKKLKAKPQEIARLLAKACNTDPVFEQTLAEGPYLNLFFQSEFIVKHLLTPIKQGHFFSTPKKEMAPFLIEFSQPNTHKTLHVGHMRNLCFGHALSTLLKRRGFSVITCTYPGDVGTHVAKCLWYLKYHNKETPPRGKEGQWLGDMYTKAIKKLETVPDPQTKNQLSEILAQLTRQEGDFFAIWKKTRAWSTELMKALYGWTHTHFDHWFWESEVDLPSQKWIKELYKQGKLEKSEGAIGIHLGEKLKFCLLLKADGNGLYATKDLYLARMRWEKFAFSQCIYIVDNRQEWYFLQIFETLKRLGYEELAGKSIHLKYNFVELKSGPMSSRKGNILPIMDLIKEMSNLVKTRHLEKYIPSWSKQKIEQTASQIAEGAIKFGMNEQDLNKKIVFDKEEWLKWDGKSGPYIQYAYARTQSLLAKHRAGDNKAAKSGENKELITVKDLCPEEWNLIMELGKASTVLEKSAWELKTSPLCHYIYDVSKSFAQFYQNCKVLEETDTTRKAFRLLLVESTGSVLKEVLFCLGIEAPNQM